MTQMSDFDLEAQLIKLYPLVCPVVNFIFVVRSRNTICCYYIVQMIHFTLERDLKQVILLAF